MLVESCKCDGRGGRRVPRALHVARALLRVKVGLQLRNGGLLAIPNQEVPGAVARKRPPDGSCVEQALRTMFPDAPGNCVVNVQLAPDHKRAPPDPPRRARSPRRERSTPVMASLRWLDRGGFDGGGRSVDRDALAQAQLDVRTHVPF